MKLLNEFTEAVSTEVLTEGTDGKKAYNITGPFIHTEEANRNGRIYIKEHMAPEVARYKRDFIDTRRALGELSHPEGPTINPDKVSHLITKLEFDGNLCIGEAKILDTPNGNIVKVNFGHKGKGGEKTMRIKKSNATRRKAFRSRHNCQSPGPRDKARYWSCRFGWPSSGKGAIDKT
jgi:hypothetical protein